jgi:hypothetical protein
LIGGALQEIYVSGTATNCASVKITLSCGNISLPPATKVAVNPNPPYLWYYTFKNLPVSCICGGKYRVRVECDDLLESCVNDDRNAEYDLTCRPKSGISPVCPPVNWNVGPISDCNPNGTRSITVKATLQGTGNYSAELRDFSNNLLDTKTSNGPLILTHTGNYLAGKSVTFHVIVNSPAGCPGGSQIIFVPKCPDKTEKIPPSIGSGGGKVPEFEIYTGPFDEDDKHDITKPYPGPYEKKKTNKCGTMVWVVGALLSLASSLTALTIAWHLCVPGSSPPVWVWGTVAGVGIAAGLAIATWYIVCGLVPECKCPTECDWLQIGTMVALSSSAILAWLSKCCPIWFIAAAFGAVYIGALAGWVASCKPTLCRVLATQLTALVSGAAPAIAYIIWVPQIAACGSTLVNAMIATIGAILAASTAAACATAPKSP